MSDLAALYPTYATSGDFPAIGDEMTEPSPICTGLDLARMWSEAAVLVSHSAGCGCGSGAHAVRIDAAMVAADILDYLAARYQAAGYSELAAFVQQPARSPRVDFDRWLEALDAAPLPAADLARLKADLANSLASMRGHG